MQRIFEGNLSSEQERWQQKKVTLTEIKSFECENIDFVAWKMNKILSVLSLAGLIVSIKADATFQPTNQPSQVASDNPPQTSYVPAATTYQNSDTISVAITSLVRICW